MNPKARMQLLIRDVHSKISFVENGQREARHARDEHELKSALGMYNRALASHDVEMWIRELEAIAPESPTLHALKDLRGHLRIIEGDINVTFTKTVLSDYGRLITPERLRDIEQALKAQEQRM